MTKRARRVVAAALSMPGFIKPQLATLKAKAPSGDHWLDEIKFDGYRVQVHINKGKKRVFTRNGLDWSKRFSVSAGALDIPGQAIVRRARWPILSRRGVDIIMFRHAAGPACSGGRRRSFAGPPRRPRS
jgi:hypothetical protein